MRTFLLLLSSLGFVSPATAASHEFDVVVYGGTSGGVAAAVTAARLGKTVVLIEPGKHIGGMTSGGLGATDIGNKAAIGGLAREFYQRVRKHYDDDASWKQEKRVAFKGPGHDPQADTAWTFEPHVAEADLPRPPARAQGDRNSRPAPRFEERRREGRHAHPLDRDGDRRELCREDVHRRHLRRRPDGQGRRLVPRRPRSEQDLRRDAQRRPGQERTQAPVHQETSIRTSSRAIRPAACCRG